MIDNQAAPQSEGGILDINRRVAAAVSPASDGVLGQLRAIGVDPASLVRRPEAPMTDAERNDRLLQNAKGMYGEMWDAMLEGRWSDVSPSQVGSAMVQAGATKLLGQTAGAAIGGVYDEIQAFADIPMLSRNWFSRIATGKSLPELTDAAFGGEAPFLARMAVSRNASADALLDDKFQARSRTVDPMASRSEMAAAIGEYDPMSAPGIAGALSSAATQVATAIALSSIPGGQVAGAARASTAIGRIIAPAKALLGNPGGRVYLGYAGGRQAIDRSADYLRFNEMDRNATSQYNAAIDRLGLGDVLDKQEVPEYSRLTDLGLSLASGAMTAFSETIGTGFSVAAGKRIIGRLYGGFTPKAAEGGMREMLKASAKGFFASGSMEGLEEVVDGYGQAIIGGWYDWTEEGGFAWAEKTGGSFEPLTIFKKHAPELLYDFAIAFAVSAPLGAGGGMASVRRRRNWHDAFTKALMRDQIATDETGATRGESDFLAAQAIAQAMAGGDPSILPSVLEHLRKTMPEIGQVTESQLRDPAWVAQFVRNFPLVAVRLSEMDSISRSQSEWLTGSAAKGRVPGSDARGQFLELVRSELRNMIPAYMQGWYERSATELEAYNRQLQELADKTDDRSRLLRAQAKSRIKFILDIRKQIQLAWVNKETIDQSTFEAWLRFDEVADGIDIDGTADAKETTPSTARSDAPGTDQIRARARAGDAEAAFTLAQMHESGQGADKHFYKSQYWMSVALANSGDVEAMVYLGRMYAGRVGAYPQMAGAPRSINKARAWLRKAYEMGSDEAGRLLADLETSSPARPRPGRIDAAEAARAARRPQAAPAASVAQPAPATPQEAPAAPAASPAVSEAPGVDPVAQPESATVPPDPAADTRRAVDARVEVEQRMQAEERAEAERRAADEADAPRRDVEQQVQQGAEDPDLRVRFVEPATPVESKIAKAAAKLGKRVQFIRIFRDEAREGARRRRTPSGIRGFVGSDANTIYLVQVPNVMREQATTAYYLQTLAHENAHGVIREADTATLRQVDALASRALVSEIAQRFDLGRDSSERREEIRVQTLTLGVVDAAGLDAILLAETSFEKAIARLKLLFRSLKIALTGNERAALLKKITQEQVARAKSVKETKPLAKPLAKPTPAPAAAEPAATRAAKPKPASKPKPATQPTDDLARLIKDGQWVIGVTLEQGDQIQVVADGETFVLDSTSKAKGIDLRIIGKKLYLLRGSTTAAVTSAKVLTKPSVGKAKPKAAQPQATAEPAAQADGADRGASFMRERNSVGNKRRIMELANLTDLFDDRSWGTLSHPVDGEDVDAENIIKDMLAYSVKVPRKYLKGVEEFEYLAAAIHHVLIEKSADSTDYERAAAVMMRALDEGIADYDQIVVAARRMGFEGTDKTVPFDIVSEEDVDPRRINDLMDDPDGLGGGASFMREIDPNTDTLPSIRVAGQSIRDALLSTPKNHPYRDIAVAIADLPIPVMSEDRVGNKRSQTDNFYSYDAAFEGQPRINLSMYSKYSTLIHEAVHAFTAESVKRSMLFAIGRRDLASAEGVDPASLNDGAVPMARRLAKAGLIEQWELDSLLTEQSEDARQSALKMAMLKRYAVDVKGDANIRADAGYMAMVEAAIADPKTPAPVRRLLELFKQAKADSDIGATATPNNRLMSPGGWDTIDTGDGQSDADVRRMQESRDIAYGLSNPLEFAAMAFSSAPFQRWLNERGGDGRKSLWERFVAIVSRILGVKNDSMLESVIEASADLSGVRPDSVSFMRERTDAIDTAYMKAVERGQSVAARKHLDAAAEAMGFERAFRIMVRTPDGERGLINREAWDDRHLTERQTLELPELLELGMQQPARGTTGTFYFTSDGLKNHAKLIRWLSNAATGEVIRRSVYFNDANWESLDGQVALEKGQHVSAKLVVRDGDGNVIPPSRRFAGVQNESSSDIRFLREKPGVAFEMFRDDSPASQRTNRLATAMLWKYTILDRAVKAARRALKIEPEDAANELFQLAPGVSARIMLDFGNAEVKPYEKAVKDLAKRLNMTQAKVMDLVQEHAFLRHALDAIAWLEKRDAAEIERRAAKAFDELDAMGADVSTDEIYEQVKDRMTALGLNKAQAQARLRELDSQFAADKAWSDLSDRLRAMNRRTLEIHREAGNITEAAYQELVQRYPNYVPVVTSLFGDDVDVPTSEIKRPARRILRRMFGGNKVDQVSNVDQLRKFWAASWDLTKYDRMKAAHAASLVPADNAMFRLARQNALSMQGGDPLVEVVDMQALVREQAMLERMRLRRERDAAEAKAREDGVELPPFKIDGEAIMREAAIKVANDIDMQAAGTADAAPSIRRFKLDRDTDMTPQEVYDEIDQFGQTGLSLKQAAENEQAAANGDKPRHTPVKIGSAAYDKRMEQLQNRIRLLPKGTVMHYRINDPDLAYAMLVNEPTMLEKMRAEGGLIARNFSWAWLKLMAFQRFAFVSASPGFWKGELFRSPQQAAIMARVMADEMRLSAEQKDAFLRNLDRILSRSYILTGVSGAVRAVPGGKPWRSVRHVLKGGEPRNAYERMVRRAIEDGVLQGGLYSVDSYETMVQSLKERIGRSMEGEPTRAQRASDAADSLVSRIGEGVDLITGGLDMVNRLNVYEAARRAGISRQQAAIMARESTVDFSKKGASIRGASQLYLFLGPRMQGIHQLLRAFSTGDGDTMLARTAASASKRILMRMFLWSFALKMLREFFYEDDDEPQSVPSQFASLQNMLVPVMGWNEKKQHAYLEINNPYGFGAIAKLADRIGEFMVGDSTAIEMLAGAVGDFGSELTPLAFDLKSPSSLLQAATPTNAQFATDLLLNQDWKGSPIYPEGAKFGPGEQRRSQQYFAANTWRTSIWLADMISDLTRPIANLAGFEGQRGIEISPNQIQYVFQRWMPGLVRQAADGVSYARGQDVTVDRLPILGSFITQTGGRSGVAGQWRDMGTIRANMKVDLKEGRESRREILGRYGDVGRWFERGAYDNAERQIKKLQEARNKARRAGKDKLFDRINERIEEIQTRVLRDYARARERSTGGGIDTMFQTRVLN